ncbi:hypothetical protein emb_1d0617 [Coriobacteriaceae bacterium EMTCatB1]|nr:hypothetical protein emb_1d0617 [Coriobacteriaceae bacterium EMTCatB1]
MWVVHKNIHTEGLAIYTIGQPRYASEKSISLLAPSRHQSCS